MKNVKIFMIALSLFSANSYAEICGGCLDGGAAICALMGGTCGTPASDGSGNVNLSDCYLSVMQPNLNSDVLSYFEAQQSVLFQNVLTFQKLKKSQQTIKVSK